MSYNLGKLFDQGYPGPNSARQIHIIYEGLMSGTEDDSKELPKRSGVKEIQ